MSQRPINATRRGARPWGGRRGVILTDALFAIVLGFVLLMALQTALHHHRHAQARLADRRELVRQAEQVLIELRLTPQRPVLDERYMLEIEPLAGEQAGPMQWVRVTVEDRRGQRESLLGRVPRAEAMP